MIDFRPVPSDISELPSGSYLLCKIKGQEILYEIAAHRQGSLVWEIDGHSVQARRFTLYSYIYGPHCGCCKYYDRILKVCDKTLSAVYNTGVCEYYE